jgi:micrococcal nuclease
VLGLGGGVALGACGAPASTYAGAGVAPGAAARGEPAPGDHARVPAAAFRATVERVVDGDTFVARRGGRLLRVRLIGIDAPESVQPDAPVECFGREASRVLHRLLPEGSAVRAAYESGGRRDRYGRQLWDVWLPGGRFLQAVLVTKGAAEARVYRPQHRYADLLARLEGRARTEKAGLWGRCH